MQDRLVTDETIQVAEVGQKYGARQRRSVQQKREMVEATLVAGASIARVARAYGVNANQLFHWRKLYKLGLLEESNAIAARLLPVQVCEVSSSQPIHATPQNGRSRSMKIEIAGKARVTIEDFDDHCLRTVLEYVLR